MNTPDAASGSPGFTGAIWQSVPFGNPTAGWLPLETVDCKRIEQVGGQGTAGPLEKTNESYEANRQAARAEWSIKPTDRPPSWSERAGGREPQEWRESGCPGA